MCSNYQYLYPGDKVHYQPPHYSKDQYENGIVKKIPDFRDDAVWVVYNCAGNWDKYENYTAAMTHIEDLNFGWIYS